MDVPDIPLLRTLTQPEIAKVTPHLQIVSLRAKEALFSEGEPGEALYIVKDGKVNITIRVRQDSKEGITILTLGPGAFFGEMAILDDAPRASTARAEADATLYRLSKDSFLALARDDSKIGATLLLNLSRTVARRNRHVNAHLALLFEVGRTLGGGLEDADRALRSTLQVLTTGIHAERSCFFIFNPVGESIELDASVGCQIERLSLSLKQPSGKLAALLQITAPRIIDGRTLNAISNSDEPQGWESDSNMILPISANDHPVAFLALSRSTPPFSDDDLNLVQSACLQMGQFLERTRLQQEMKHQNHIKREYFTL